MTDNDFLAEFSGIHATLQHIEKTLDALEARAVRKDAQDMALIERLSNLETRTARLDKLPEELASVAMAREISETSQRVRAETEKYLQERMDVSFKKYILILGTIASVAPVVVTVLWWGFGLTA